MSEELVEFLVQSQGFGCREVFVGLGKNLVQLKEVRFGHPLRRESRDPRFDDVTKFDGVCDRYIDRGEFSSKSCRPGGGGDDRVLPRP